MYAIDCARPRLASSRCCAKLNRSPGGCGALIGVPPKWGAIALLSHPMDMNPERVDYRTEPSRYKHWRLAFDGPVATLIMDTAEDGGLRPGYKLKLNSYDLGVDIELHDALQRIRFEHPEIRTVVVTSGKSRIFCSGANIYMLG